MLLRCGIKGPQNSFFIVCGIVPTMHLTTTGSIITTWDSGLAGRIAAGTEEPNRRPNESLEETHTSCDGTGRHDCDGAAGVIANTTTSAATATSGATATAATAAAAEEQHNSHPVAKGAAAGAAFGAASSATGGNGTTVVHTGSANRSGSANHQAKPQKTGKSSGKSRR